MTSGRSLHSSQMLLKNSIENILKHSPVKRKEHAQMKKACESALESLNAEIERSAKNGVDGAPAERFLADRYFLPFELACKSRNKDVVIMALDSLQKLIAHGLLVGDCPDSTNPDRLLIDRIVETICDPFQGPLRYEDGVQLQVIMAILVVVLSNTFQIHEGSLLTAVRTCFNIFLATRSPVNQSTAKGVLTQTVDAVFLSMERHDGDSHATAHVDVDIDDKIVKSVLDLIIEHVAADGTMMVNGSTPNKCGAVDDRSRQSSMSVDGVPNSSLTDFTGVVTTNGDVYGSPPPSFRHQQTNGGGSVSSLDAIVMHNDGGGGAGTVIQLEFRSVEEKDAFLIFRALCKLSMKQLPEDHDPKPSRSETRIILESSTSLSSLTSARRSLPSLACRSPPALLSSLGSALQRSPVLSSSTVSSSHELHSKLLSLEMILRIVQNFNIPLTERHSFLFVIRRFLCFAVTQNAASPIISVFEKALAIFVQLVNKFKVHLKAQIEVFFKEIIISILESPSSSFEHKWIVLNSVSKICDNAQSVVDIYINYDCHLTSANVFEILVNSLSKISRYSTTQTNVVQKERTRRMRELALDCLIKILQCLFVWYEECAHIGADGPLEGGEASPPLANGHLTSGSGGVGSHSSLFGGGLDTMSANQLAQVKQQKSIFEHGFELFSNKPEKGLRYLQDKGFVGGSPIEIARFFHTEERLDQTVIGDYLGDGNEFNQRVMHEYVDFFDFSGSTIVQALRKMLDKFRLPGEAQKIDRIMEKFASRYCGCNPNSNLKIFGNAFETRSFDLTDLFSLRIFASADTAYILSYSIIMLTTDLHSPQVKQKMTKEQYIKLNSGINEQSDLPKEFLSDIYDDIAANEIKTRPSNFRRPKLNIAGATWRQRKLVQNIELENIAETAHALMEAASVSQLEFMSASNFEHVRPMFSLMWSACLAAFSIGLRESNEEAIWRKCLEGFRYGIRVACVFRMSTEERNAFVQGLTRFTLLAAKSSLNEVKIKNIESIKLLITIGDEFGNFLDECWYDCLTCISQLELAQLISVGGTASIQNESLKIDGKSLSTLQVCLGETSSQSVIVAVDKIFQGSSKLSGEAIVHFVRSLCRVSVDEFAERPPRMYMLQKIVEISFYNMNRIRIEWSMIWNVLSEHFNLAGCHSNEEINHFALDALKQLSMKFLEKGELPNFQLQKEFLRPFEVIMARNNSTDCHEMVIACITHMVQSHADKIRSGWKSIFAVCSMAAAEINQLEPHSVQCILNILFQVYADASEEEKVPAYRDRLHSTANQALDYYLSAHSDWLRHHWLPVMQLLLNRTCDLPRRRFNALGADFQLSVVRLVETGEHPVVRAALHRFVQRCIFENSAELSRLDAIVQQQPQSQPNDEP